MTSPPQPAQPPGTVTAAYPHEALELAAAEVGRQLHGGAADPDDIKFASDILAAAAPVIRAAERERWARKLREMAAAVLPEITTVESLKALAKADPNSPLQAQGRLLLQLADLLNGATDE